MTDSSSASTDPRPVASGGRARGRLRPPASKSLTQRYYNLALLASGRTVVEGPLRSADCDHFLAGLAAVGCRIGDRGESVSIVPPAEPGEATVHCGASGTMMRLLTATLCAVPGRWRLDGVPRLRERPQAALLEALRRLGARITPLGRPGFLPLEIVGGSLVGGATRIAAHESSQFVSALLMAAGAGREGLALEAEGMVSRPYVTLTLAAMRRFGLVVDESGGGHYRVRPGRPAGREVAVEPDLSAACYPAAAASLTGGEVLIEGIDRNSAQGDVAFFDLLEAMGARIDWRGDGVRVSGHAPLRAVDADLSDLPDQVPTLAALAPFALGTTRLRNVAHLRLKESDRLAAMARELRRLGASVAESEDGLSIEGTWATASPPSDPVTVDSHDDHRIAMSCALVGLRRPGVSVAHPEVVAKSYPDYWRDLEWLTR